MNLLRARLVFPSESGGSGIVFDGDDAIDVREEPELLLGCCKRECGEVQLARGASSQRTLPHWARYLS